MKLIKFKVFIYKYLQIFTDMYRSRCWPKGQQIKTILYTNSGQTILIDQDQLEMINDMAILIDPTT